MGRLHELVSSGSTMIKWLLGAPTLAVREARRAEIERLRSEAEAAVYGLKVELKVRGGEYADYNGVPRATEYRD